MTPAEEPVKDGPGDIFIDDEGPPRTQDTGHICKEGGRVGRVMKHIGAYKSVEARVRMGKMNAIEGRIVDRGKSRLTNIDPHRGPPEETREVVRDKAVAAAHVENARTSGELSGDLLSHEEGAPELPSRLEAPVAPAPPGAWPRSREHGRCESGYRAKRGRRDGARIRT